MIEIHRMRLGTQMCGRCFGVEIVLEICLHGCGWVHKHVGGTLERNIKDSSIMV